MGSFNVTCIASGLPIEAGTPVRFLTLARSAFDKDQNGHICYVGGRWQMYGVPIKAKYNDYGSVEKLEESITTELFFEALRRGAVEKGVGDNQCHDVSVRSDMDRKEWLEALWEGRVEVLDARPYSTKNVPPYEPAPGIPSLARIEAILKAANFSVAVSYGAKGYVIDEAAPGYIRIRMSRGNTASTLEDFLPFLHAAGFAAMITIGTGNYADPAEILVAPLPNKDLHGIEGLTPSRDYHGPRPVSQAMIREDVWQILRGMQLHSYSSDEPETSSRMRERALAAVEEDFTWRTQAKTAEGLLKSLRREHLGNEPRDHFMNFLHGHEGTSGFTFREAYKLGLESDDREAVKRFAVDLADTIFVQWAYSHLHGQWHPTTNGNQDGNWPEHRAFHTQLANIHGQWENDEDDDIEEPEEV